MGASAAAGRGGLSREWQAAHGAPQALQSLEGQFRGATRRAHSFGLPIVFAGIPPPAPRGSTAAPPPGRHRSPFPSSVLRGPYHSYRQSSYDESCICFHLSEHSRVEFASKVSWDCPHKLLAFRTVCVLIRLCRTALQADTRQPACSGGRRCLYVLLQCIADQFCPMAPRQPQSRLQ